MMMQQELICIFARPEGALPPLYRRFTGGAPLAAISSDSRRRQLTVVSYSFIFLFFQFVMSCLDGGHNRPIHPLQLSLMRMTSLSFSLTVVCGLNEEEEEKEEKKEEEEEELSDEYVMEGVESNEPAEIDKLTPG